MSVTDPPTPHNEFGFAAFSVMEYCEDNSGVIEPLEATAETVMSEEETPMKENVNGPTELSVATVI